MRNVTQEIRLVDDEGVNTSGSNHRLDRKLFQAMPVEKLPGSNKTNEKQLFFSADI